LLSGWIQLEYDVELKRQQLVSDSEDFNTIDAFRLLDVQGRGEVPLNDLRDILKNQISKVN
jgi:Ca2+-binding EF-hand superfamily protein